MESVCKRHHCAFRHSRYNGCDKDSYISGIYIVLKRTNVKSLNTSYTNIANSSMFLCERYSGKTSTTPQPRVFLNINTNEILLQPLELVSDYLRPVILILIGTRIYLICGPSLPNNSGPRKATPPPPPSPPPAPAPPPSVPNIEIQTDDEV